MTAGPLHWKSVNTSIVLANYDYMSNLFVMKFSGKCAVFFTAETILIICPNCSVQLDYFGLLSQ